jgi:uncharacterized membrane protein YfcA
MLTAIVLYALLGSAVGVLAGLFGVGGGLVMVPVLTALFLAQGAPVDGVLHMALATSMAAIVPTSLASLWAHHQRGGVQWSVVRWLTPGIVLGTLSATFVAAVIPTQFLAMVFTLFVLYAALQMSLTLIPKTPRPLPRSGGLMGVGGVIGSVSALVSIGGGALTVPFLVWHQVPLKQAIASSAAVGFPLAVAGALGYLINGLMQPVDFPATWGWIHWPAVLMVALTSPWLAPVGVALMHRLPVPILKRMFALLLIMMAVRMLWRLWQGG